MTTKISLGLMHSLGLLHGACKLDFVSSTEVRLNRCNGRWLVIDGRVVEIPNPGLPLSNAGLSADTVYYVYASSESGSLALVATTTGHVTYGTEGVETMSAYPARTLVGMVRTNESAEFQDAPSFRGVASWFNRRPRMAWSILAADRTTTQSALTALAGDEARFLTWGEDVRCWFSGSVRNSGPNRVTTSVGVDGLTSAEGSLSDQMAAGAQPQGMALTCVRPLAEGDHYVQLLGGVDAGTGTWEAGGGLYAEVVI